MSNPFTESSLTSTTSTNNPYTLYAITSNPDTQGNNNNNREAIQLLCPYTGSNLTGRNSIRVSSSTTTSSSSFGISCFLPIPMTAFHSPAVWVGHGGGGGRGGRSPKDDSIFLLSSPSSSSSSSNENHGNTTKWKVRPPEPLSCTSQSMAVSPHGGRYVVLSCISGNCYLHQWMDSDNLLRVWKAHYRPVTCCVFDEAGTTLFTGGEDGVINAWSLLDLLDGVDNDHGGGGGGSRGRQIHPCATWSEHSLPVTWIHVCKGGAGGCMRLISCSLDRHLIVMEMGAAAVDRSSFDVGRVEARTLARMCLPSGLHCVSSDSVDSRLYCGGEDGKIYCVDMDAYAIHETLDGGGTVVRVDRTGTNGVGADLNSILSGKHVMSQPDWRKMAGDQSKYVSELKGACKSSSIAGIVGSIRFGIDFDQFQNSKFVS
eukprot:CCRYP_009343-RA/>CCRYP_009343-RA protein AED:0.00 eAED:0.00 QI:136/-1/1/1/-1/1/1/498/427